MLALKIIGIIAAIILLICLISVGVAVNYENKKLELSAYVCGLLVQILPKKEKKAKEKRGKGKKDSAAGQPDANAQNAETQDAGAGKKKRTKKAKKSRKNKKNKKKKMGLALSADEILGILKKVFSGVGKFTHGWKVPRFMLHYTAAGDDPYDTAVMFGYVNMALSTLAPVCSRRFNCKDVDVRTDIDFQADKMTVDFGLTTFIRLGSIFAMINTMLFGALGILIKNKCRLLWFRITDKKAYLEFEQEQIEKKEKMAAFLAKLKKSPEAPAGECEAPAEPKDNEIPDQAPADETGNT